MYLPKPIDTSGVELSAGLQDLLEKLAENVHDQWALMRMEEGWSYGKTRNDALKQNPCLVPYQDLPESEKEYDRKMAAQNLKTILSLGYRITK